jgi:hypothetical protein
MCRFIMARRTGPYRVLGYLSADTAPVRRFAIAAFMARRARELGGDALILTSKRSEYSGSVQTFQATGIVSGNTTTVMGTGNSFALFRGKGEGVVIKFLKVIPRSNVPDAQAQERL